MKPSDVRRICLPRRSDYAGLTGAWRRDLVAGLTVGIVALPLALGFGVTSGLGAAAGLVTAVIAGFVAAVFGGSRFQVSGPTGAMTVVLAPIVLLHGTGSAVVVALMAGILVVTMALTGVGRLVAFIPWPVVEGFTLGIAAIIFLQQVPTALGTRAAAGTNTAWVALQTGFRAQFTEMWPALVIVLLVAAVMMVAPRIHRSLPGSLVAVVLATLLVHFTGLRVSLIGALPASLPSPAMPSINISELGALVGPAFAIAVLCAIESLLSARVAEQLAPVPGTAETYDPDRELFGQGLASIVSGLFGGMPATGAIARTAVNVRSGAHSRVAAILHAVVLLVVIYLAAPLVGQIPLAALAGVLIMTSIRMVERHSARAVLHSSRSDALVFVLTALSTVLFDLIVAVEVGLVLAGFLALRQLAAGSSAKPTHPEGQDAIRVYRIDGALFFGASPRIFENLDINAKVKVVILRLRDVQLVDASGAARLGDLVKDLRARGILVLFKGVQGKHLQALEAVGVIRAIQAPYPWEESGAAPSHIFDTMDAAMAAAARAPGGSPVRGLTEIAQPTT